MVLNTPRLRKERHRRPSYLNRIAGANSVFPLAAWGYGRLLIGSPIFQPGLLDGGKPARDKVAELTRWVDLRADRSDNTVDGPIADLAPQDGGIPAILYLGDPLGVADATVDVIVQKFGRTTTCRAGRVSSVTA